MPDLDLAVFGNLAVDDVVYPDGRTRFGIPGGAALYAALGARLWGIDVGLVSCVGKDFPHSALKGLEAAGIYCQGIRRLEGPGLRTWILNESRRRRWIHHLESPNHRDASPEPADVPEDWAWRAAHLGPMPWTTQRSLLEVLTVQPDTLVGLDAVEELSPESLEKFREACPRARILFLSEDECPVEREEELWKLAGGRLGWIAHKRGDRGGFLYDLTSHERLQWSPQAAAVVDTTGAGDAFAGGVLAGRLLGDDWPQALERGARSASVAITSFGPEALLEAVSA